MARRLLRKLALPTSQSSTISYVLPTQALGVGSHHLVASYPGDPSFGASQGSYTYTVSQAQGLIEDFFPVGDTVANAPVQLVAQVGFTKVASHPMAEPLPSPISPVAKPLCWAKARSTARSTTATGRLIVNVTTPGTRTLRLDYTGDTNVKGTSQTYYVPFTATDPSYVNSQH